MANKQIDLSESAAGEEDPGSWLELPGEGADAIPPAELPERRKLQTRAGALEYMVSGQGTPSIVLMSGAGVTLDGWRALYPDIEALGTVFAWNRFGVEGSDAPQVAQSGAVVVASLRELLSYAGLKPPYLLVGHSLGGLHANLFARLYPQEVSGVLFLEAAHPGDPELRSDDEEQLAAMLAKVTSMPQEQFRDNLHAEIEAASRVAVEIEAAGAFPAVPVTVVTGNARPPKRLVSERALLARRAHQEGLARLSPQGVQVLARQSGHFPHRSEPALVIEVLGKLIERVGGQQAAHPT